MLGETWQLLRAHFGIEIAERFWERLRAMGAHIETVIEPDLQTAGQIADRCPKQDFSFVDRTSIAVMERTGISRAATFNPAFAEYRYGPGRKKAFEIRSAGHSMAFSALRDALLRRVTVRLNYGGEHQTVCPYILGHAAGEERAFALVIEHVRKGPAEAKWVCLRLAKIRALDAVDEPWIEQDYPGPVQRCVDQVHLDAKR